MKAAELISAVVAGGLGLLSAYLFAIGEDKMAGIIVSIGLFLCNVVWILRLF